MDKELEAERLNLEKMKVATARHEMAYLIKQRQAEIKRLQDNIANQMAKEAELDSKINELNASLGA
jgi:hypothetical protein